MALFGFPNLRSEDPWAAFDQLRRNLADVLAGFGPEAETSPRSTVFPPVNLYETDTDWILTAEVPGLRAEDVEVSVEENRVTLRGERKIDLAERTGASVHRRERQAGCFSRTFTLPQAPEADKTEASYRHGVLSLRLPKPARSQPRQITIQAS
jgi:HSP20 family protein